jgi:hypothetical protein
MARGPSHYEYIRSLVEEKRRTGVSDSPTYPVDRTYDDRHLEQFGNSLYLLKNQILWAAFVRRDGQVSGPQGFPEYAAAVKQRLAKHGFTQTFQLTEDLDLQDKTATWIEYLGFEYWWFEHYEAAARRLQARRNKDWSQLVRSDVLWPEETQEFITDVCSCVERHNEEQKALTALQRAVFTVFSLDSLTRHPQRIHIPLEPLHELLLEKRAELEEANEEYRSVKRRNSRINLFLRRIRKPAIARRDAKRHRKLLGWIVQQLPLIESEANVPDEPSNGGDGAMAVNRKRSVEVKEEEQSPQSADEGAGSSSGSPSRRPRNSAELSRDAMSSPASPSTMSAGRRSARIAERAERVNAGNRAGQSTPSRSQRPRP